MSAQSYHSTRVLIGDFRPEDQISGAPSALRPILNHMGFSQVSTSQDESGLEQSLMLSDADLVIFEHSADTSTNAFDVIHKLRHGTLGRDPFLPVLGFTGEVTEDVAKGAVGSGLDNLLTDQAGQKRFSAALENLVARRKPFVVTTDYIGPNRRSENSKREGQEIPLIPVPNALRCRVTGEPDPVSFAATMVLVQEQKVERHAAQIAWLTQRITEVYCETENTNAALYDKDRSGPGETIVPHIKRLQMVAMDLALRLVNTRYAHQVFLCNSLLDVSRALAKNPEAPRLRDVGLLAQLSLALQKAVRDGDSDDETLAAAMEIVKEVQGTV